jgi:hypothetical protein
VLLTLIKINALPEKLLKKIKGVLYWFLSEDLDKLVEDKYEEELSVPSNKRKELEDIILCKMSIVDIFSLLLDLELNKFVDDT